MRFLKNSAQISIIYLRKTGGLQMATIVENMHGRRLIRMSTDDVISIVREYQACSTGSYKETREKLDKTEIYVPEDL